MQSITLDRKMREFTAWLFAGFLILLLLTSCAAVETITPSPQATPSPTATATATSADVHYWQLAAGHPWRLSIPALTGGKINYSGE